MAQGRMLNKSASRDPRLAQLGTNSLVLFLLSIPHLDRDGRMDGLHAAVRGNVVSYVAAVRPADWTDMHIEGYMTEWTRTVDEDGSVRPLVLRYRVHGVWACQFLGFRKNQTIRYDRESPSVLPPPPPALLATLPRAVADLVYAGADPAPDADSGPDAVRDQLSFEQPPDADSGVPGAVPAAIPHAVVDNLDAVPVGARGAVPVPDAVPENPCKPPNSGVSPDLVPPEVEVEVKKEERLKPADQRRAFRVRAREASPAALLEHDFQGGKTSAASVPDAVRDEQDLGREVAAGVECRQRALLSHGPLARLLEVLPDMDANTAGVMHALYDPLGLEAIEFARAEILAGADEIRSPSAYAQGIARRLAGGERRDGKRKGVRRFLTAGDDRRESGRRELLELDAERAGQGPIGGAA